MTARENPLNSDPPQWLLDLLRCPISGLRLQRWNRSEADVERLGTLTHRDGRSVLAIPSQGLLSDDGRWLYPVHRAVACLVPGEAIDLGGA